MTEFDEALGRLLRRLREQAGISQRALADVLLEDQAFISRLESGRRHVSVEMLLSYLSGIGVGLPDIAEEISSLPGAGPLPSLWQFRRTDSDSHY
ncbi:MAG: helix-turn-helix domain-containing protein [Fimbriimonadaceae bacterium]|nr:helix-turn-helix domain-containing protein [Fimbriimonadaceae bacterium]